MDRCVGETPYPTDAGFACSGLASPDWHLWLSNCSQSSASASSSADSLELNCKLHRSQIPRAIGVRFTTRRSRFGMALLSDFIVLLGFKNMLFSDFIPPTLKTTVFGLIIGLVSCFQGMRTRGGTEGVGRSATSSVVLSSLFVVLADVVLVRLILTLWG